MKIIKPNHLLWHATSEVRSICEPLFKATPITYFNYARSYDNGDIAALFTHPEWLIHSLEKKVAPSGVEFRGFQHYTVFGTGITSPLAMAPNKYCHAVKEFNELLNFNYLLALNYQQPEYYEAFAFATTLYNSNILEFYFNNLDYLEKFTVYFRDKAEPLIRQASNPENRIIRPNASIKHLIKSGNKFKSEQFSSVKNPLLTRRELQCLNFIAQGRTAKEIGQLLAISERTVETHINNMKIKLNCHKKSELINFSLNNNFLFDHKNDEHK